MTTRRVCGDAVPYRVRYAERQANARGEDGGAIVRAWMDEVGFPRPGTPPAPPQARLKANGRGGAEVRNRHGALLRGLLRCRACDQAMTHTFTGGTRGKCYRYYRCVGAIKGGAARCPAGSLPAAEIERLVIDEVRGMLRDRGLLAEVVARAHADVEREGQTLGDERAALRKALGQHHRDLTRLASAPASPDTTARIADLQERAADAEQALRELDERLAIVGGGRITKDDARAAFTDFDALWASLSPKEQSRLLTLLIEVVQYDGPNGTVAVTFRPTTIRGLGDRPLEDAA